MSLDCKRPKGFRKSWNGGHDPILASRECDQCGWKPGETWKSERCGSLPFGSCDGTVRPHRDRIIAKDAVAFDLDEGGYHFHADYLVEPKGEALVEISKDGQIVKSFLWPAYKIWNIAAHTQDIAADLERGLTMAGEVGFGANVYRSEP